MAKRMHRCALGGLLGVLIVSGAAAPLPAAAALAERRTVAQHGGFTLIGNTLAQDCAAGVPAPVVGTVGACGTNTADAAADVLWRSDAPFAGTAQADTTVTPAAGRSTAVLTLPPGATVTDAFLYWASQAAPAVADASATLERPTVFSSSVPATTSLVDGASGVYVSVADVTAIVQVNGAGPYRVADVDSIAPNDLVSSDFVKGWWLVVFYARAADPYRALVLHDGLDHVTSGTPSSTSIGGFIAPTLPTGSLAVVGLGGDGLTTGDSLTVEGSTISNAANPAANFFNGSRSSLGFGVSTIGDLPQLNGQPRSLSQIDLDVVDVAAFLTPGQTSLDVDAATTGDELHLTALVLAVDSALLPTPTPTATPTATPTLTPTPTATVTPPCAPAPLSGCKLPTVSGKASLQLVDKSPDGKDQLQWKWLAGALTTKGEMGTPTDTTAYQLCVYDGASALLYDATIPAGGTCGTKDCWAEKPAGYDYKNKAQSPDGVTQLTLREGLAGKAKIQLKAAGGLLDDPAFPLVQPVVVQLVNGAGVCWEADYGAPAIKNTDTPTGSFKDKAD